MRAIESYDEAAVQAALDDGLAAFGLESLPYAISSSPH